MEKEQYRHMEPISSVDFIVGRADRFEPTTELFVTLSDGTVYGVIPYLDHYSNGYYFVTNQINGTVSKPRVVLLLTAEAFDDSVLVGAILTDSLE